MVVVRKSNLILFCFAFIALFGFSSISFSQEKQQKIKTNERNVPMTQQVNNSNKKAKQVTQQSGVISQFVKKYIITDENPAFGDKQNAFLGGVYFYADRYSSESIARSAIVGWHYLILLMSLNYQNP